MRSAGWDGGSRGARHGCARPPLKTFALAWGVVLASLGACSSEAEAETPGEVWCEGLCAAVQRCDVNHDQGCPGYCVAQRPGLRNLSLQGARALEPCLADLSCEALADEALWEEETNACWERAVERVEPTPESRVFCAEYARRDFECQVWFPTVDCEPAFSMLAPALLGRLAGCVESTVCESIEPCIEGVIAAS